MNKLNKISYTILLMDLAYKVEISSEDCVSNAYSLSLLWWNAFLEYSFCINVKWFNCWWSLSKKCKYGKMWRNKVPSLLSVLLWYGVEIFLKLSIFLKYCDCFFKRRSLAWRNYQKIRGNYFTSTKMDLEVKKNVSGIQDLRFLQKISFVLIFHFFFKCMVNHTFFFVYNPVFSEFSNLENWCLSNCIIFKMSHVIFFTT